jgi:hypothetical protein
MRAWRAIVRTLLVVACAGALAEGAAAEPAAPPWIIAPVVEGLLVCDDLAQNEYRNLIQSNSYCTRNGRNGLNAVNALLDDLEPGGPQGQVQVGYTITVQLLSLYRQRGAEWVIDEARVDRVMRVLEQVKRPAVLYLAANQFDTQGAITASLVAEPRNLMQLADGSVPNSTYFGYRIVPYTLLTDESIPVNRYRFTALRHVAQRLSKLSKAARERLVAVTLAGEVHHMFPDFEGGMGAYDKVQMTDYSPGSIAGFRVWLKRKYVTVERLNAATGGRFGSFTEVTAPSRNVLATNKGEPIEHFDGYADGTLPVAGWLWDPQGQVRSLELVVDGQRRATMGRDFNRLDVYRAVDAVDDPSVGFRQDLDHAALQRGSHVLQVVAVTAAGRLELARRKLEVLTGSDSRRMNGAVGEPEKIPPLSSLAGVRASLDLPQGNPQRVLFNPLAREWNDYRAHQVSDFLAKVHQVARSAGLPADKLYSHQIVPRVNSSWNPQFFAVDASLNSGLPWKPGFNAYGGAAGGPWMERFIREHGITDYGVPEFHPQQWKRADAARRALALHRRLGARFVSPYYLSVISDREEKTGATLNRLEIRANNTLDGSDQLYRAIRELAAQ